MSWHLHLFMRTVQLFDVFYKNFSMWQNDCMAEFPMSHGYSRTFQSSNIALVLHLKQEFNQLLLVVTMWQQLFSTVLGLVGRAFQSWLFFGVANYSSFALCIFDADSWISVLHKVSAVEQRVQAKFNNWWRFLSASWPMFCGIYFGLICCSMAIPFAIQTLPLGVSTNA